MKSTTANRMLDTAPRTPTVALLPWGHLIDDFLDSIGVSFEAFCTSFTGSFLFGYVRALQAAGVHTVLVVVTGHVAQPTYYTHAPTGAGIYALPPARAYRLLQRFIVNPYGRNIQRVFGELRGLYRLMAPFLAVLRELLPYLPTSLRGLDHAFDLIECDAVLCQEYEYARFDLVVLAARRRGLPVFATFQGGDRHWSRLEHLIRPWALRASTGLIIATASEIERVRAVYGLPAGMITRIFNPLDADQWQPGDRTAVRRELGIAPHARVAVWHGRVLMRHKGLDVLLDAWAQVCSMRPNEDVQLILIGTGVDANLLAERLQGAVFRHVRWHNAFVHDRALIQHYLSAANVYVFPSRHEGFPVAPLEAMACGLPVVAADAQGIPDIFEHGEADGGLVVPRDDAAALAQALGRLLYDPALARSIGENARQRVEGAFSLPSVGHQLRDLMLAAPTGGRQRAKEHSGE